jgi:hypothetical protein
VRRTVIACLLALGLVAAAPRPARASAGDFGLGLILGDPTGLSGKYFISRTSAVDFAVGVGFVDGTALHVHVDYLVHLARLAAQSAFVLDLTLGVGPKLRIHGSGKRGGGGFTAFGPRVPIGLAMGLNGAPVDLFLEVAPGFSIVPGVGFFIDVGLGARYYF